MKKTFFILLLVLLFSVSLIYGESVGKTTAITVNPIGFLVGSFNAQLDLGVGSSMSIVVGGSYWKLGLSEWTFSSIGIQGGARYYWQGDAVHGWYVNPLITVNILSIKYSYTDIFGYTSEGSGTATSIGYGGMVGYQSIWDSGIVFDFGLGYQMATIPSITIDATSSDGSTSSVSYGGSSYGAPLIQLAIGYAF